MDGQNKPPTQNEDDFAAASHSTADYLRHAGNYQPTLSPAGPVIRKPQKKTKVVSTVAIGLVVLLLLIGGGYYLLKHHKKPVPVSTAASSSSQQVPTNGSTTAITTQYVSNGHDLNLSFNYPTNWSVTPPSNGNSNDQPITVTSPLTAVASAAGGSVSGKVVVSVRPGTSTMSELNSNNPVAAQASTQIGYTQPTANQYQYPYLTFVHFSGGAATSGAFEEVIITGTTLFSQGNVVSNDTLSGLDPIISASFVKCSTTSCTGSAASPLSITSNIWQTDNLFKQTLTLLESFKLN